MYYNAGRTGMRSDIPQWMPGFVAGCPDIRTFRLWAPWGDCGGLSNALLGTMASGWSKLETLEVAGEGITLTGEGQDGGSDDEVRAGAVSEPEPRCRLLAVFCALAVQYTCSVPHVVGTRQGCPRLKCMTA